MTDPDLDSVRLTIQQRIDELQAVNDMTKYREGKCDAYKAALELLAGTPDAPIDVIYSALADRKAYDGSASAKPTEYQDAVSVLEALRAEGYEL